ncbi:hypothetical protein FRB94_005902 [Tulasnella sp. JGI-2019a]|nr:hypothetical protein FRB94_005902 [Tulasnella sp. JGI-2019a]KAG9029074.1 hypothetical protein FRB95_005769 [Tulasnella sp. JGI-2019a]
MLVSSIDEVPYTRGRRSLALPGLIFTFVAGFTFIALGVVIYVISPSHGDNALAQWLAEYNGAHWQPGMQRNLGFKLDTYTNWAVEFALSTLVTVCTESTGYVHATTLKWGLAREGRLTFNANLRLFSATKRPFSVNGPVVNALFSISMILSYAASSSIFLRYKAWNSNFSYPVTVTFISFVPPIILGMALVLQATLAIAAFYNTHVPTWSTSPLDVTSALVHHGYTHHQSKRCIRSVSKDDNYTTEPIRPTLYLPSPREAHKEVG